MIMQRVAEIARSQPWLRHSILSARRLRAAALDRLLNIHTTPDGVDPRADLRGCVDPYPYEPMDYPLARRFLRSLDARSEDVVYDIGCGMGRVLCVAARLGVKRCVGIEVSTTFAEAARRNARRLRGRRCQIEVLEQDAAAANYADGTVFLLFNPFGEHTLRLVLDQIERSMQQRPREVRIGYGNPMHEDALCDCGWLQRYAVYRSPWYERPSSFWRGGPHIGEAAARASAARHAHADAVEVAA